MKSVLYVSVLKILKVIGEGIIYSATNPTRAGQRFLPIIRRVQTKELEFVHFKPITMGEKSFTINLLHYKPDVIKSGFHSEFISGVQYFFRLLNCHLKIMYM